MTTLTYFTELEATTCGECGILFAAPKAFWRDRRNDSRGWYCPNGHNRVFREMEADRLKRELATAQTQLDLLRQTNERKDRELHGARIQVSKARNELQRTKARVANGVCPCCQRSFVNLQRHMKGQHPNFITHTQGES